MNKLNAGKASVLALSATLVVTAFLFGTSSTSVFASHNNSCQPGYHLEGDQCVHNGDGNGNCGQNQGNGNNGQDQGNLNNGNSCGSSTPTATPTPTPTATPNDCDGDCDQEPTATPTATPSDPNDLCPNIEGVQTSIPEGWYRLDGPSFECRPFQYGGPGNGGSNGGVTGTGTGGQVLGASTMAGTGSFDETVYQAIMSIGATLSAFGLKGLKKAKKVSKK